jgi:succinoglycan biosynthesis transport protein ExoP
MEEEIDLRAYVLVLLKYWKWILGTTVAAAVVALVVSFLLPPTYEATALVVATKQKVEVQFGTQIRTLTEEEMAIAARQPLIDRKARLETFRELVVNPLIAEKVLPAFADQLRVLDEDLVDVSYFLDHGHVKVEGDDKTDLIAIKISLRDPELAADIANAWAKAYVEHINSLYSAARPEDVQLVTSQAEDARKAYLAAQQNLEAYLAQNPIPRLNRQIELIQTEISSYQNALVEAQPLVGGRELATRRALLEGYYSDLVTIQRLLDDVKALRSQMVQGTSSPAMAFGEALAMVFAQSRAFGGGSPPFSLQLQTPMAAESVTVSEVDALIQALESRKTETEAKIDELTGALLGPPVHQMPEEAGAELRQHIETLTTELQSLQAQLEAEQAHRKDLERQRDLAWDTYAQLAKKSVEVQIAAASTGTEVRIASLPVPPSRPVSPRKLLNTAVAGALGLMLSVFGAFGVEWWRSGTEEQRGGGAEE